MCYNNTTMATKPFSLILVLCLSACVAQPEPEPEPEPKQYRIVGDLTVHLTTMDQANLYTLRNDLATLYVKSEAPAAGFDVTLDPNETYQNILGVGASFTDASAYLMHDVLSETKRQEMMKKLFSQDEGIGISFIRNPMGSSDYARFIYSYDDQPAGQTDEDLSEFSIAHDEESIIPLILEALALNPNLKVMASPWSAPGWMKSSGSMIGGSLNGQYYGTYAQYFVKYIQAYADHGIDIFAITPQNEPLYVPGHYPGMSMSPTAQAVFIKDHLRPAFDAANLDTKILAYDHNWDRKDYPLTVLERAGDAVDGVAWHVYGGNPIAQTEVWRQFPDHEVYFTEGSGGEWVPPFANAFQTLVKTGIDVFRNYSRTYVLWNMALDENNGPVIPGFGNSTCRGIVTINQATGELTYNLDYYVLAHFSDYLQKDAVRIDSSKGDANFTSVAFLNPDGTIVTVLYNQRGEDRNARVILGDQAVIIPMEGQSVVTLVFQSEVIPTE